MKNCYTCCVPGCPTVSPKSKFLQFPVDSDLRKLWIESIPRKNWIVDHSTLICIDHFEPAQVQYSLQMKPQVSSVAIPTIYAQAGHRNILEMYQGTNRVMFEVPSRDFVPETFGDLAALPDFDDYILDYYFLSTQYQTKLSGCMEDWNWSVKSGENYILFYQLYHDEVAGIFKVDSTIKIDADLKTVVSLGGILMDPLDLTRFIPITGKLNRWSQLKNMLNEIGEHEEVVEVKLPNSNGLFLVDPNILLQNTVT